MTLQPRPYLSAFPGRIMLLICALLCSFTAISQLNASFYSDKEGGCPPFTIQFSNNTSGVSGSAVYHWDFGNSSSTQAAPLCTAGSGTQTV